MGVLSVLPLFLVLAAVDAGYYKIRPPPPPPPPPASIHYGHSPPVSKYARPSASHYPPPPSPYYPSHHRHPPSRIPYSPVKAGSVRHYTRYPYPGSYPHKPVYSPYAWKNGYKAYRPPPPVVKETFTPSPPLPPAVVPSPASYPAPSFVRDDDKGPIHTIPAPNLGPQDKPANLYHDYSQTHVKKPLHSTQEDLSAVLKHGITKVNIPHSHSSGYQVTEDPSLHQPHLGSPSYFAPDPSPDLPTVKVPPTNDPHSLPSNGQVPLDLYFQQEAEKNTAHHHHSESLDNSNHLTAQDLFNLLNYNPGNPVSLIPQAHLQQHVLQPNVQFYNPSLFVPQNQHLDAAAAQSFLTGGHQLLAQQAVAHNFKPQFQTFNYDEQTQQGAHGSDSFPAASMSLDVGQHHPPIGNAEFRQNIDDTDNNVEGSDRQDTYVKIEENEVAQPQPEAVKKTPFKDIPFSTKSYAPNFPVSIEDINNFTDLVNKVQQSEAVQSQETSQGQSSSNNEQKTQDNQNQVSSVGEQQPTQSHTTNAKPEDNVQLQKSIQIFETTLTSRQGLIDQEIKNLEEYGDDYTEEEKLVKEMAIGQPITSFSDQQKSSDVGHADFEDSVPYGARIRPKRF